MSNFPIRFTPVTRKQIITLKTKKLTKNKYILLCIIFILKCETKRDIYCFNLEGDTNDLFNLFIRERARMREISHPYFWKNENYEFCLYYTSRTLKLCIECKLMRLWIHVRGRYVACWRFSRLKCLVWNPWEFRDRRDHVHTQPHICQFI